MLTLRYKNISHYLQLMRVDRPIGTFLVAWPMLWALWIAAEGIPKLDVLIIFLLGAFLMRSAGCVINDYADRHFDGQVKRTQHRPLAQGLIQPREAVELFILLCVLAFILLLFTNQLTLSLSVVAVVLAFLYPFMKRFTYFPQVFLGLAFGWAIPMAFAAQANQLNIITWLLFAANIVWVLAYDTFYAMVDRDDDLLVGIKSTAIVFGDHDRFIIACLQAVFVLLCGAVGVLTQMGLIFYIALLLIIVCFIYQQSITRTKDRTLCFKAFTHNNYVGLLLFVGIALHYFFAA